MLNIIERAPDNENNYQVLAQSINFQFLIQIGYETIDVRKQFITIIFFLNIFSCNVDTGFCHETIANFLKKVHNKSC